MNYVHETGSFERKWPDAIALVKRLRDKKRARPKRYPAIRMVIVYLFVVGAVLFLLSPTGRPYAITYAVGFWSFIGGFVFAVLVLLVWARALVAQQKRKFLTHPSDQWQIGPWRVHVSREGIENISSISTHTLRWEAVSSIEQTDDHVFFIIATESGYCIPRSAFISDEHLDDFVREAKRLRRDAKKILDAEPVASEIDLPPQSQPSTNIRI